jgi:hypothetical protein
MNRPPRKNGPPGGKPGPAPEPSDDDPDLPEKADAARLKLRRLDGNRFAFLAPVCAFDRQEDLEEVRTMIAAGELEIARDELLYLVSDCRGFLEAHNLLGELALEEEDISLARGHFGFAYEIGLDSLPPGFRGILPAKRDYNRAFFLAGRGLARCLIARGQQKEGRDVLVQLAKFDPQEEHVKTLLKELDERDQKPSSNEQSKSKNRPVK